MADPATLDDVVAKQDMIIAKLDQQNTKLDAVKTATESAAAAAANDVEIIGSPGIVNTGVNSQRVFVVSPWPPES